jgi:hypothetical protein
MDMPFHSDEIKVHTEDLCQMFGGCERCPGITTAGSAGMAELEPEEPVFCIHWCHLKPEGSA